MVGADYTLAILWLYFGVCDARELVSIFKNYNHAKRSRASMIASSHLEEW